MRLYKLTIFIALLSLFGCNQSANIASPQHYKKNNIQLSYPANWDITDETVEEDFFSLIIEGGEAMFILQRYPSADALPLETFASSFSEDTKEALPFGSAENIAFSAVKRTIMSQAVTGAKETFSLKLLGIKVPHAREYFKVESGEHTLYLISHIPTESLASAEPGFKLIYDSIATR